MERTLADRERVLGETHPDTLTSRNNLASAYQAAGRLDEAIPLYERTLADRERVLGETHPDTLASRNNLASAYQAAGRLAEAIPLYERTLADCERVLGETHPDTLGSRNNLAGAYQAAGRLAEAIPLYERTLADCERVLGETHPDTLTSRNNLASAYQAPGGWPRLRTCGTELNANRDCPRSPGDVTSIPYQDCPQAVRTVTWDAGQPFMSGPGLRVVGMPHHLATIRRWDFKKWNGCPWSALQARRPRGRQSEALIYSHCDFLT